MTNSTLVKATPGGINSLICLRHENLLHSCVQQRSSDSEWQWQNKAVGSVLRGYRWGTRSTFFKGPTQPDFHPTPGSPVTLPPTTPHSHKSLSHTTFFLDGIPQGLCTSGHLALNALPPGTCLSPTLPSLGLYLHVTSSTSPSWENRWYCPLRSI